MVPANPSDLDSFNAGKSLQEMHIKPLHLKKNSNRIWQMLPILVYKLYVVWKGIILALLLENQTLLHANNKGADQPAHQRSLISMFVICLL